MPPLSLLIKPVSGACNLSCRYCFYADEMRLREKANYGRMTPETLEILVRRAFAYAEGSVSFAFQGGEPTLAGVGFYRNLLELEEKYNTRGLTVSNSIQTNGVDLSDELLRLFAEHSFLVGVSLDGPQEVHDRYRLDPAGRPTWDRVRATLSRMEELGVEHNLLCVVHEEVAQRPRETLSAMAPERYLQFIPCLDSWGEEPSSWSLGPETYLHFLRETFAVYAERFFRGDFLSIRNFDNYLGILLGQPPENCAMQGRCGVYFLIESDGSAYPCDFYVLDEYRLGNVREDSFRKLERSPVGEAFRQASVPVRDECRACRWYALCRGGCRRERETVLGQPLSLNRFCGVYRTFFAEAYPTLLKMAKEVQKRG